MTQLLSNCLVTGASGFIGRELCTQLQQKKIKVRALLRKAQSGPWDEAIVCEDWALLNAQNPILKSIFKDIDTLFYFAGLAHVRKTSAAQHMEVNCEVPVALCRLAAQHQVKNIVYCSSVAAEKAENPYGVAKREAEKRLLALGLELGIHISIVRPPLVYGPGLPGNLCSMIKAIQSGWFPPIPETQNQRSMVSVNDLASATITCAINPLANGKIYTVTDGVHYSSRKLYDTIREALGFVPRTWAIPRWLLEFPASVSKRYGRLLDKLLGSEFYSADLIKNELAWSATTDFYREISNIIVNGKFIEAK